MKETQVSFGQWLFETYLDWQKKQKARKSIQDFADLIGVSRSLIDKWMDGTRTPTARTAELIARKFGPEVYDLLGMERPDLILLKVVGNWDVLSESTKIKIDEIVDEEIKQR